MKKAVLFFAYLLYCGFSFAQKEGTDDPEFEKHVAFINFYTRNLNASSFVREVRIQDFSGSYPLPAGFGFEGDSFADDGEGHDRKAGDGLYTSIETHPVTDRQENNKIGESVSVSHEMVADPKFLHGPSLARLGIAIECDIELCCPCGTSTCWVCEQRGWRCVRFYNCRLVIGW